MKWTTGAMLGLFLVPFVAWSQPSPGIELYNQGKFAEAAKVLDKQVKAQPNNVQALAFLGLARVRSGDANGALEPLNKAIGKNADHVEALYGRGLTFVKLGRLDDAVVDLKKATTLNSKHAYAHYNLGMTYNKQGKKDLAIPHLRRFVELAPDAPEARAVRSFLSRI